MSDAGVFVTPGPGEPIQKIEGENNDAQADDDVAIVEPTNRRTLQESKMSYEEGELFSTAQKQMRRQYEKVAAIIAHRGSPGIEDHVRGISVRLQRATQARHLIHLHSSAGCKAFEAAVDTLKAEDKMYTKFAEKVEDVAFKKMFVATMLKPHQVKLRKVLASAKFCHKLVDDLESLEEWCSVQTRHRAESSKAST